MAESSKQSARPTVTRRAWRNPVAVVVILVVAAAGAASDIISKNGVFDHLLGSEVAKPDLESATRSAELELSEKYNIPRQPDSEEYSRAVLRQLSHNLRRPMGLGAEVTVSLNPGVVFGFDKLPRAVVNGFTVIAILGVGAFFAFSRPRNYWLHIALGLILGGAIGNLYDRLFSVVTLPGLTPIRYHVRDFLDFGNWGYPWIFNLADVWLVVGVAMILIENFRPRKKSAA